MVIKDFGFGREDKIFFRFSEIDKFHENLLAFLKNDKDRIPDFPRKKSFGFFNRTNNDLRKI